MILIRYASALCLLLFFAETSFEQQDSTISLMADSIAITKDKKVLLTGYVKDLSTVSIPSFNGDWTFDNFIHGRLNFKWYLSNSITIKVEARNRIFFGESIKHNPEYVKQVNASLDYIKLGGQVAKGNSYLLNTFFDRANITWDKNKWQVIIGKQRINWSKSYVWNPNDIFNAYSFFDFDYEERRGTDAALVKYSINNISSIEAASNLEQNFDRTTTAAKYNFNLKEYDFQFIGGKYQTNIVFGAGWAGQIKRAGFKGEAKYFQPYKSDTTKSTLVADVSFDYTFPNTLNFRLETIYNSNPLKAQSTLLFLQPVTANRLTFSNFSLFLAGGHEITPLIKAGINGIVYIDDKSFFVNPTLNLNLTENIELLIAAQTFGGSKHGTFSNVGSYVFTRLKWSF